MPDMTPTLISLYKHMRDCGFIDDDEFKAKRKQLIFEGYVGLPIIVTGFISWVFVFYFIFYR